ncbi:hypothetical protein D3C71_1471440 [compost metagenome]
MPARQGVGDVGFPVARHAVDQGQARAVAVGRQAPRDDRVGAAEGVLEAGEGLEDQHLIGLSADFGGVGEFLGRGLAEVQVHVAAWARIDHGLGQPAGETLRRRQGGPDALRRMAQPALEADFVAAVDLGRAALVFGQDQSVGHCGNSLSRWFSRASRRSTQKRR